MPSRSEITTLLKAWSGGDPTALDRLAEQVYPELRRIARRYLRSERLGHTLQPTALVNEVYLRLVDVNDIQLKERAQFFALAAQLMRRILVDAARARSTRKRGASPQRVSIENDAVPVTSPDRILLALDEALNEFSRVAPRQAKVVELRYFGGLAEAEIVEILGVSPRTVRRDWDFAKAWLLQELNQ
jgi:RNA polymerase sigma factor (TIGR02999 family)